MLRQMLRDNFSIPTWLMLGALIQGLLCFLPYRNLALVAPVCMVLALSIGRTMLQTIGVLSNPYIENVVTERTAIVYPDSNGSYATPGGRELCTIMLAVRSNHPLGILADGYKEVGDHFGNMCAELNKDAAKHGFLGNSSWLAAGERGVSSEFMSIMYFDSVESLHNYAHGPLHTKAMEWWRQTEKKHKHIGIMHEVYYSPKNCWEGIYVNYHPTGLGATSLQLEIDGKKQHFSPLVQGKGQLRYSKGRMGRTFSDKQEWPEFEKMSVADGY